MPRNSQIVIIAGLFSALLGCAGVSHIPLSSSARSQIRTVTINPDVSLPKDIFFYGMTQATAGVVGGVAADQMIGRTVTMDDKAVLKHLLEKNNINVDKIFYSQMKNQLTDSRVFASVAEQSGDARFNISVAGYGLFKKGALSPPLRAAIWADVYLVKTDGTVVWQKRFKPQASEDRIPAYSFEHYQQNPEALRKSFEVALEIISKDIIADLKE
jgi:hypothetical protein